MECRSVICGEVYEDATHLVATENTTAHILIV